MFGIHDSIHYKLSELVTNTVTTHGFKASSYIYRKLCFVAVWRANLLNVSVMTPFSRMNEEA